MNPTRLGEVSGFIHRVHPGRLTWNIIMEVWKIIFLSKWVICRFHVNLPGCKITSDPVVASFFLRDFWSTYSDLTEFFLGAPKWDAFEEGKWDPLFHKKSKLVRSECIPRNQLS